MNTVIEIESPVTRKFNAVMEILERYQFDSSRLITILQLVQEEYRYLPKEVLPYIATALNMPIAEVYGVATFYAHFSLEAKGKYVIKVCNGTACHVKGSMPIVEALYEKLNVSKEQSTTPDMMFTVETVSCLGACGLAPVMVVNDKVFGEVTPESIIEIIDGYLLREE